MARLGWRWGALLVMSSCIIYQVDPTEPDTRGPREPREVPSPDPEPPTDLWLVDDDGAPGESLRTRLVTGDPAGLDGLQVVRFERDVTVTDAVFDVARADLLLAVAPDAAPGSVDVIAQFAGGATVRIGDGFTILAAPAPTGDTGPSTPTGDTGP